MVKAFVTYIRAEENSDDYAPTIAKGARRRDDRFVMLIDRRTRKLYVFPPHVFDET